MEKKNIQHLDFFPRIQWPSSLPAILIGKTVIAGFNANDLKSFHQLPYESPQKTSQQFFEIHPHLTLPEIARVLFHPLSKEWLDQDQLIKYYGYHPSPDFYQVTHLLTQLPMDFQNWVGQKKIGPSELFPLLPLPFDICVKLVKSLGDHIDSKSDTIQKMEWLSDLILMKHSLDELLGKTLNQIRTLRFPETAKRDEHLKNTPFPWLNPIKTKMHRKGDTAGFDVQFFAGTPVELEKIADNLKKVASSWNSSLHSN